MKTQVNRKLLVQQWLVMLFICIYPFISQAQDGNDKKFNFTKYNNEIGILNLERVFDGSLSAFFIYKRRISSGEQSTDKSKYWRYQLSLLGRQELSDQDNNNNDFHRIFAAIGKEWASHSSNRFTLYYGSDIGLGYAWQEESDDLSLSVRPFLGAKFHITERFHLSLESMFFLRYQYDKNESNGNNIKRHSINYGFDYLRFLTLGYYF